MILDIIVESTRKRVINDKSKISEKDMMEKAYKIRRKSKFKEALSKEGINLICEIKKASPSKGVIAENFPYKKIAKEYEEGGASAISILTEPEFFKGSDEYLKEIRELTNLPLLRKDFIVDEYQIYQAKVLGADAILLICSILTKEEMKKFLSLAKELELDALVEAHNEEEVRMAIECDGEIIGVNNRDLKTFEVDINNSIKLRKISPKDKIFVAESGIKTYDDIKTLKVEGVNGVLIGETLMRAEDKVKEIKKLRGSL